MKFNKGDLVFVKKYDKKKDSYKYHFQNNCEAIVMGSYSEECLEADNPTNNRYTLFIKDGGETSWYDSNDLKLLKHNQFDLLKVWRQESAKRRKKQMKNKKKGRFFGAYQILCLSERTQDMCKQEGIKFNKYKSDFVKIVEKQNKTGKADMGIVMDRITRFIKEVKKPK